MRFLRLKLKNWRNFLSVDVPLKPRTFIIGTNASGKSNLLDVFRFLREIADEKGGFQNAVSQRGGVSQIRSLHARRYPTVLIEVEIEIENVVWNYLLEFKQDNKRKPIIEKEILKKAGQLVFSRPEEEDLKDKHRLTQTYLEQVSTNKNFRVLAENLAKVRYLHIVPQLVREPERSVGKTKDPYGGDFLEQLASTPKKTLDARLNRIRDALKLAVPQLSKLELKRDQKGVPHLQGLYKHWRPQGGWQAEDQFSDGTLRLMGLLWSFLDGQAPLLLEEPELSLNVAVVRHIPKIISKLSRKNGRQIILSTHSVDLLSDEGISAEEVLLIAPTDEGSYVLIAAEDLQIRTLIENGMSVGDAALPRTAPQNVHNLSTFGD